jgi:hypothetical protein
MDVITWILTSVPGIATQGFVARCFRDVRETARRCVLEKVRAEGLVGKIGEIRERFSARVSCL